SLKIVIPPRSILPTKHLFHLRSAYKSRSLKGMKVRRSRFLVLCLCTFLLQAVPSLAGNTLLPIDDLLSMRTFSRSLPIDLSSDGAWVAYTLQEGPKTVATLASSGRASI